MSERIVSILAHRKQRGLQLSVGILLIIGAAALAIVAGWLALEFMARLIETFEVIGEIVGWILWPFSF